MRGAKNTQNGGLKFIQFMGGKFVERVDENTSGAISRELEKGANAGKVVHELHYDTYEGQIYGMETEESEYGKRLHILVDVSTLETPDDKVKITLPLSSGAAKGFLSRLPVIDFNKDVCLKGFDITDKQTGKRKTYLVPYQEGQKLAPYFTKETPNGLPEMKQIKVKGALVWDDTEQLEFFEALFKSIDFPKPFADEVINEIEQEEAIQEEETPSATSAPKGGKLAF